MESSTFPHKNANIQMFNPNEGQISLYLILEILFPPLRSNMGREMLGEFHFCRNNCPLKKNKKKQTQNPSDRSESGCPLHPPTSRRDFFVISVNLDPHAVRQRSSSLHFWPLPHGALRPDPVPHALRRGICAKAPAPFLSWPLSAVSVGFLTRAAASVTLLRPSLGTSADTALRHRVKPQRRVCVSRARSGPGVRCWDLS